MLSGPQKIQALLDDVREISKADWATEKNNISQKIEDFFRQRNPMQRDQNIKRATADVVRILEEVRNASTAGFENQRQMYMMKIMNAIRKNFNEPTRR